ncbi:MAG TPA: GNAT family N-acetyltransferase [Candidatus Limnocylindria bacterium]
MGSPGLTGATALDELHLGVRHAVVDDAPQLFDLISAIDLHDFGDVDMTVEEVRDDLAGYDLANDSWLVFQPEDQGGALVAFAAVEPRGEEEFRGQVSVHPAWRQRGIGSALARHLEQSVRDRLTPDASQPTPILGFVKGDSEPERHWAEGLGYEWSRRFWRMRVDLEAAPPEPEWPEGITVRDFVPGQDDRAMYDAQETAFADHWGHVARPFDDFLKRLERSDFDPSLWHLAMDGDRIVATASNSYLPDEVGWVSGLGTIPEYRRRGIARALLLHSFGVFWRRGMHSVALGVDADSLTGATGLYESVGMRVVQQYDQFRKLIGYSSTE